MENETAPATEKRPKKPKNKTAESAESLISTHFSGFPLYQFRCCDVHRYSEIDTIQRCTPNLITMHPLANGLKSAFLHNKCTPFRVCIRECRYTVPATEQTVLFQNPIGDSHHQMYFYIYGIQPKNKFNHDYYNLTLPFSTSSRNLSTSFFVSLDLP